MRRGGARDSVASTPAVAVRAVSVTAVAAFVVVLVVLVLILLLAELSGRDMISVSECPTIRRVRSTRARLSARMLPKAECSTWRKVRAAGRDGCGGLGC